MHKSCPGTSFSVNLITPSDTFESISSKFVRTRIPSSHVEVLWPISAHGANYVTSFADSPIHRGIRHRVLTNQRDRSYVYADVSLAAGGPFVGGPIVTYIFSRVSVGSACVRVWKTDCDVTSLVEHRVKSLQQNGP